MVKIPIISGVVSKIKDSVSEKEAKKIYLSGGLWFYPLSENEKKEFLELTPRRFWTSDFLQKCYFENKASYRQIVDDLRRLDKLKSKEKLSEIK